MYFFMLSVLYIGILKDTYLRSLILTLAKIYVYSNAIWTLSRIFSSNPKLNPSLGLQSGNPST